MATRDVGTTQRPPSTALLTIDSEDRFNNFVEKRAAADNPAAYNFSPYNFSLVRDAALINGYMTRLAVSEVVFPWVYPNLNDKTSVIVVEFTIGAGPVVDVALRLDVGFATPANIAAQIESAIDVAYPALGFTMTYGQFNIPRFSYGVGAGNAIRFKPLVYGQTYGTATPPSFVWTYPSTDKQLFDLLGFTNVNTIFAGNGVGQATLAQATRYIDIVSPQLTANQGLPDATSQPVGNSALCRLYLGDASVQNVRCDDETFSPPGCAPFVIYRQFTQPKQIQWNAIMPVNGRIQFQVLDDNGDILPAVFKFTPFTDGEGIYFNYTDWSMTMLLTEN